MLSVSLVQLTEGLRTLSKPVINSKKWSST
jgi:hypothetical protein